MKYVVGLQRAEAAGPRTPPPPPPAPLSPVLPPASADSSFSFSSSSSSPAVVEMVSAQGRRFRCIIPPADAPSTLTPTPTPTPTPSSSPTPPLHPLERQQTAHGIDDDGEAALTAAQPVVASVLPASSSSSSSSSSSLSSSTAPPSSLGAVSGRLRRSFRLGCFVRVDGWWTYELCPFKQARQFHTDGSAPAGPHSTFLSYQITTSFTLGTYDADGDEWLRDAQTEGWLYVQHYTGGTDGREATVRFLCSSQQPAPPPPRSAASSAAAAPTPPPPHVLSSVTERSTHRYDLEVQTPLACHERLKKGGTGQEANSLHQGRQQRPPFSSSFSSSPSSPSPSSSASLSPSPSSAAKASSTPPPSFPGASSELRLLLELLHPLRDDCLHFFAQYWTYRLCYLDGVHQFHRETIQPNTAAHTAPSSSSPSAPHSAASSSSSTSPSSASPPVAGSAGGAAPVGPTVVTVLEYDLGRFVPSTSPSSASSHSTRTSSSIPAELTPSIIVQGTELVQGVTWEDTYARQVYTQGTACGLPNLVHKQRRTELRFVCDQSVAHSSSSYPPPAPSILSLSEVSTCEYLAIVSVPALCRHPSFSPAMPLVHEIQCVEIEPTSKDRRRRAREQRRRSLAAMEEEEEDAAAAHSSEQPSHSDAQVVE